MRTGTRGRLLAAGIMVAVAGATVSCTGEQRLKQLEERLAKLEAETVRIEQTIPTKITVGPSMGTDWRMAGTAGQRCHEKFDDQTAVVAAHLGRNGDIRTDCASLTLSR